jgi:riboflavin kinase/FMN adenylyltransferase
MLSGTVVKGRGLGKQLQYPTANILIEEEYKLIPKQGVYIVKSNINNTVFYGMMNIGINPTVDGNKQSIEVHFFDFDKDIYGIKIQIDILQRIRDEEKFESIEGLKTQLANDKKVALDYIAKHDT